VSGAAALCTEWSATLAMLQAESCVSGAAALCTETARLLQGQSSVRLD